MNKGQVWLWAVIAVVVVAGIAYLLMKNAASPSTYSPASPTGQESIPPTLTLPPSSTPPLMTTTSPSPAVSPQSGLISPTPVPLVLNMTQQNDSNQSGTVTLKEINGKTQVTIAISPGSSATPEPAHIHLGSCPTPGNVKYPLTSVVNGKSVTTINVSLQTLKNLLPLAVNVHKSATDISTYVSCGDLSF